MVDRYIPNDNMLQNRGIEKFKHGWLVLYSDYAALESENARLRELLAEYMAAEHGEKVCLAKGYKPELEALVNYLGWSKDYISNQIIFEPPRH